MNPNLVKAIEQRTPKIDPRIGFGLSFHENENIPKYVDRLFRINARRFPSKVKYLGYAPCTPHEGYKYMTRVVNNNTRFHDVNKNDIRLYSFNFEIDGYLHRKFIYLPFIRRHGFMYMNGVKYIVAPVMADGIITIKPTEIFIKLIKTKMWFEKINSYPFMVDGVLEYSQVYFSKIYNKPSDKKQHDPIKMKSTLVHYMCCKFGLRKSLEMLGFKRDEVEVHSKDEWNKELSDSYPPEEWMVVESLGKKPPKSYGYPVYEPTKMFFMVKRDAWARNKSSKTVFASLFYVFDHYTSPKRMNPNIVDDVTAWRSMMGEVICSSLDHAFTIESNINKHLYSLDGYIDDMVMDDLTRIGLGEIDSIYKLFVYIIENFMELTCGVSQNTKSNSLYGKQLQVCQFLLFDLTKSINNAYFNLAGLKLNEEKNPNEPIKRESVIKTIDSIRTNIVMQIKNHTEIIVVDDPGDLPILKMGRMVIPQEKSDKAKTANSSFSVDDPTNSLHESLIEVGGAFDMSKSDPSGRNRLNPFVTLSEDNTIIPNPELAETIQAIRDDLYR